jgi:hypothetical protein
VTALSNVRGCFRGSAMETKHATLPERREEAERRAEEDAR